MKRVLAIGAHPDDIELGCGGTLAKLVRAGDEVHGLCVTSGDAGSATIDPAQLAATREAEARAAGEVLGLADVHFLGLRDGLTAFTREDKVRLVSRLRALRPEVVFVHSSHDRFPDHEVVHRLVMAAVLAAAGPWYQEASGEPWAVGALYGYEVWHPSEVYQMAVDVTDTLEAKLEALRCHASQVEAIDYLGAAAGLAAYRGALSGVGRHAEVFEVLRQPSIC